MPVERHHGSAQLKTMSCDPHVILGQRRAGLAERLLDYRKLLGRFLGSGGHEHRRLVEKGTEFAPVPDLPIAAQEAVQKLAQN